MKTVTVIIAARQAAAWLPQCLSCAAAQRLPGGWRAQILLGVDACIDTLIAAGRLRVPHLEVYYFPDHVGPYVIFNSLASSHPSDVLVRFDADDVMLDNYLLAQLNQLGSASSSVISQTWSTYVDCRLRPVSAPLANGKVTKPDGRRSSPSDGQFLMTYAVWRRLGAFRPWWCHGDSEFMNRAKWSGISRETIRQYLYLRRVHSLSLTQSRATGYASIWRKHYAGQIAEATRRYFGGLTPECLQPAVARHFPGRAILEGVLAAGKGPRFQR
jgi:glycosyltransferase involved in cell wall biosynthesis